MINFILKDKNSLIATPVNAHITGLFSQKNAKIKMAVGCKITPSLFGHEIDGYKFDRNLLYTSRLPEALKFRLQLEKFEIAVNQLDLHYLASQIEPTVEEFKTQLLTKLGRATVASVPEEQPQQDLTFIDFVATFCTECRDMLSKGRSQTKEVTIVKYEVLSKHFQNFEEVTQHQYSISDISYDVVQEFIETINMIAIGRIKLKVNHLRGNKKIANKKGYSQTSLKNILATFKFLLKQSRVYGHVFHPTLQLDDKRLSIAIAKSSKDYYLSEELLLQIYNHKPLKSNTQNAKDYIMIASTTGMRYQSVALLHTFQPQHITTPDGESFMAVTNRADKTGITLLSPLMLPAQEVFERLGAFPEFVTLVQVNRNIRALMKEMKIDLTIDVNESIYVAGNSHSEHQMCDVITSHVCRASFITCLLLAGAEYTKIQAMTHRALSVDTAFERYNKSSASDRAITFYTATKDLGSTFFAYKKGTQL